MDETASDVYVGSAHQINAVVAARVADDLDSQDVDLIAAVGYYLPSAPIGDAEIAQGHLLAAEQADDPSAVAFGEIERVCNGAVDDPRPGDADVVGFSAKKNPCTTAPPSI